MILRRLGNKSKLADKILAHFPEHKIYVEPFFGAGGMFFNKPKSKYNILNDLDSEVFNLYQMVSLNKDKLIQELLKMPISEDLWNYWKKNKETDNIRKAIRFLFLSNFGFLGKPATLRFNSGNAINILINNIDKTHKMLFGCEFMNTDFRNILDRISFKSDNEKFKTLIYCDPPYLDTGNNYNDSFNEKDSIDLFNCFSNFGGYFAMSEFDNEFILDQVSKRNLNIAIIGERRNLTNRKTEILITNYKTQLKLF